MKKLLKNVKERVEKFEQFRSWHFRDRRIHITLEMISFCK